MKYTILVILVLASFQLSFCQETFYKGEITHISGETEAVYIKLYEFGISEEYANEVTYKPTRRSSDVRTFAPGEIAGFQVGGKQFISTSVQLPDRFHILKDSSKHERFVEKLIDGKYSFYRLVQAKKHVSYYYQEGAGALTTLIYLKKSGEKYRTSPKLFRIPDGSILSTDDEGFTTEANGNLYLMEDQLYELQPYFRLQLSTLFLQENCEVPEEAALQSLSFSSLTGIGKSLGKCNESEKPRIVSGHPMIKTRVLLTGTLSAAPSSVYVGQEAYGASLEFTSMNFSRKISLGIGYLQHTPGQFRFLDRPVVDNVPTARVDTMVASASGYSTNFRVGYHFLPQSSTRPFLYAGITFYQFERTIVDTQDLRVPITTSLPFVSANGGVGIDWYFLPLHQLRFQVGFYPRAEFQAGYGFSIY